jgi:malate dehydrogenase (oxaloacetate-decarboxylating)
MSSLDGAHNKKEALVSYTDEDVLAYHKNNYPGNGKIGMLPKTTLRTTLDLTLAYSPGVAIACKEIQKNPAELVYDYCAVGNTVGIVSNGTRILGLGDIGPRAGLPVMEGKAILFKGYGYVDAWPIMLNEKDPDKLVDIITAFAQSFGAINLEDIRKPDCYKVEEEVIKRVDIPVWHDDQWGTALVTVAGFINACKLYNKKISDTRVVLQGSGASGTAIAKMLLDAGVQGKNMILSDRLGAVYVGRKEGMDHRKDELATASNPDLFSGDLDSVVKKMNPDFLIGASSPNSFTTDMVRNMNTDACVFAIANPVPEIWPEDALEAGAKIVATGRSDYKNQINNVLGFPGVFRGALDVRSKTITTEMKVAAAHAVADRVTEDQLSADFIMPLPTNYEVYQEVAVAVAEASMKSHAARINRTSSWIRENFQALRDFYLKNEDPMIDKRKI